MAECKGARVYSFDVFATLRENIELNVVNQRVEAHNIALGDVEGVTTAVTGAMVRFDPGGDQIATRPLDDFRFENSIF